MNTALILRDPATPPIHVLEVDGPRYKFHTSTPRTRRFLRTNNQPLLVSLLAPEEPAPHPSLKSDWDGPYWEIHRHPDGMTEVLACRPNLKEIIEDDLPGRLGAVIRLVWKNRCAYRNALHIARKLAKADPKTPVLLDERVLWGVEIETNLTIYSFRII